MFLSSDLDAQVRLASEKLFVLFGLEILKIIPGRVSEPLYTFTNFFVLIHNRSPDLVNRQGIIDLRLQI